MKKKKKKTQKKPTTSYRRPIGVIPMRRTHIRVARLSAVRARFRVALNVKRRPERPAEEHDAHDLSR